MKKVLLLLVLYGFVIETLTGKSLAAKTIAEIIRDFYSVQGDQLEILVIGRTRRLIDFIDRFKENDRSNFPPLKIRYLSVTWTVTIIDRSAILIFHDWMTYRNFNRKVRLSSLYPKQLHLLVYILEFKESQ